MEHPLLIAPLSVEHLRRLIELLREGGGDHLSDDELVAYADGKIPPESLDQIDLHLSACEECAGELERLLVISEDVFARAEKRRRRVTILSGGATEYRLVAHTGLRESRPTLSLFDIERPKVPDFEIMAVVKTLVLNACRSVKELSTPSMALSSPAFELDYFRRFRCSVARQAPTVYLSCSQKDGQWLSPVWTCLEELAERGLCRVATAPQAGPAGQQALGSEDLAVILISADYLGSEFIQREELPCLLERYGTGKLEILPVLLRDCAWEREPWLASFKVWTPAEDGPVVHGRRSQERLNLLACEIVGRLLSRFDGERRTLARVGLPQLLPALQPDQDEPAAADAERIEGLLAFFEGCASREHRRISREVDTPEDFDRLFERYFQAVYRFFAHRGLPSAACSDLAQQTFLRVYRGSERFRGDVSVRAWIFEIATNLWHKEIRRRQAGRRDMRPDWLEHVLEVKKEDELFQLPEPAASPPVDAMGSAERRRLLREALDELPPRMRRCVLLRLDNNLKYREIASLMQISISTVKSQLSQAQHRLKRKLDRHSMDWGA